MQKDVGMACQKVCKQGRDDAPIHVVINAVHKYLSFTQ